MTNVKTMRAAKIMEDVDTMSTNPVIAVEEDAAHKKTGIGADAVVVEPTVILHITVGHMKCLPIWVKNSGTQQMDTKRTRYGVPRCRAVRETAPDRSGRYLLIKLMCMKFNNMIYLNYYVNLL